MLNAKYCEIAPSNMDILQWISILLIMVHEVNSMPYALGPWTIPKWCLWKRIHSYWKEDAKGLPNDRLITKDCLVLGLPHYPHKFSSLGPRRLLGAAVPVLSGKITIVLSYGPISQRCRGELTMLAAMCSLRQTHIIPYCPFVCQFPIYNYICPLVAMGQDPGTLPSNRWLMNVYSSSHIFGFP